MQIGKYEVTNVLAEGIFADVYEAREPEPPLGLGRRVVVKVCSTKDESVRQRFALETQLIAQLGDHANITSAYDMGYEGDWPFLVEEYVTGEDLRHKIARRDEIPVAKKVEYLLQLAKGLEFAHSKGILHRDIKPENVRIADDGQVKIMDFGIGKVIASEATRLTASGAIVGTIGYLSPEQIRGEVDERSDIFSFAVVAYEFLTYRHPFPGSGLREQLQIVMTAEAPPIHEALPDCPADLADLLTCSLDKDPDERPPSFRDVVRRLRGILVRLRHESERVTAAPTVILEGDELQEALAQAEAAAGVKAAEVEPAPSDPGQAPPPPRSSPPEEPAASLADVETAVEMPIPSVPSAPPPAAPATEKPVLEQTSGGRAMPPLSGAASAAPLTAGLSKRLGQAVSTGADLARRLGSAAAGFSARLGSALRTAAGALASGVGALGRQLPAVKSFFSRLPRWALAGAGVVLLLVLSLPFLLGRAGEESPPARADTAAAAAPEPVSEGRSQPAPAARIEVDAFPWAKIERVESLTGEPIGAAALEGCMTPCVLAVAPGSYRLILTHPDQPEREESCEVSAAVGLAAACRVQFAELAPLEFFREAGWWD